MLDSRTPRVRSFNRLVSQTIGALQDHYLGRGRPLGEARLLFEIGTRGAGLTDFLNQHDGDYCIADVPSRWDIGGAKVWGAGGRYRSAEWGLTVL